MTTLPNGLRTGRVAWVAVALYGVTLTYLLLAPHPLWLFGVTGHLVEQAVDRTLAEYVQHGTAYAILAWLIVWASRAMTHRSRVAWALLTLGHGFATEWLQGFVPDRYCGWPDVVANVLGAGLGWFSAVLVFRALSKIAAQAAKSSPGISTGAFE